MLDAESATSAMSIGCASGLEGGRAARRQRAVERGDTAGNGGGLVTLIPFVRFYHVGKVRQRVVR